MSETNLSPAAVNAAPRPDTSSPALTAAPPQTPKLNAALAKVQATFIQPEKTKELKVFGKDQKLLYTTKYADLNDCIEAVRPHLAANGLSFVQKVRETPKGWRLVLQLKHESGEVDESHLPLELGVNAQQIGSQLTYLKRYQFSAFFGIAADDDDDGNRAVGNDAAPARGKKPAASGPKPVPKDGPQPNPDKAAPKPGLSDDQIKRLYAMAKQTGGWNEANIKNTIAHFFQLTSVRALNKAQYEWLCKMVGNFTQSDFAIAVDSGEDLEVPK